MHSERWHVTTGSTDTGDFGRGIDFLSIGPYEDDSADSFAFSENFPDGIPDDVDRKFALMAAAPDLLAACKAAMVLLGGLGCSDELGDFYAAEVDRVDALIRSAVDKAERKS